MCLKDVLNDGVDKKVLGGLIAGIAFARVERAGYFRTYEEFSWGLAIGYWLVALFAGTLVMGLADVVRLLTYIDYQIKRK